MALHRFGAKATSGRRRRMLLRVAGDKVPSRAWQIWTAQSKTDGSDWKTVQRTFEKEGYRTEQEGQRLRLSGGQIYNGWPEKDGKDDWQLWTAISKKDGSDFRPVKRTADSGWIPNLQVAGNRVYYMYPTIRPRMADPSRRSNRDTLLFAVSDADGDGWRVIPGNQECDAPGLGRVRSAKGKSISVMRAWTVRTRFACLPDL